MRANKKDLRVSESPRLPDLHLLSELAVRIDHPEIDQIEESDSVGQSSSVVTWRLAA